MHSNKRKQVGTIKYSKVLRSTLVLALSLAFLVSSISVSSSAPLKITLKDAYTKTNVLGIDVHVYKATKNYKIILSGNNYNEYADRVYFVYKAVKSNGAVAGMNGGLFTYLTQDPKHPEVYHKQNGICFMKRNGKTINLSMPFKGTTDVMYYDNRYKRVKMKTVSTTSKKITSYAKFKEDSKNYGWAISGGVHSLIKNGSKMSDTYVNKTNPDLVAPHMRALFGVTKDGSYEFIIIPSNVTLPVSRDIAFELGCINVIVLDGDASSTLVVKSNKIKNGKDDWYIYPRKFSVRDVRTCILLKK
ncbi:MAG: phosphodiester glycosidase family protein [Bacillota bacterium]